MFFVSPDQLQSTSIARETVRTLADLPRSELEEIFFPPQLRPQYFPDWSIPQMLEYLGGLRNVEGRIVHEEFSDDEQHGELRRLGRSVFSSSDLALIEKVAEQAARAHEGQFRKRSGASYFTEHVLRVVQFTVDAAINYENACFVAGIEEDDRALRLDVSILIAALLHDVVEDSDVGQNQLELVLSESEQGRKGAYLAAFLAKHDWRKYPGNPETDKKNMKEQAELFYYNRLSKAPLAAVLIKVCDRLANLSSDWVTPGDDFPKYALETQRPFSYLFARLVAALPEGGVMRELQEQFDSLLSHIVETSPHSARASEVLLRERECSAFEQEFLSPDFDYDAVRYQTTEMVRGLIPGMERAIAEILEIPDPESRKAWTRSLVAPLESILREQEQSEAVRVLRMNVLGDASQDVISSLAENPLTIRLLLPKLVSNIVTFGDSNAASQVSQWGTTWLTAITNALTQVREIGLLESSLPLREDLVLGDSNRIIARDVDHMRLELIRSLNSGNLVDNLALEGLKRKFFHAQHISLRADLSQILVSSLRGNAANSSIAEDVVHSGSNISSLAGLPSSSVQPNDLFLELFEKVRNYADGLRETYGRLNSRANNTTTQGFSPFFSLLRSGEHIHFDKKSTLYDVIQGLRAVVPLWRSSTGTKGLPVTVSIESPQSIQRALSREEARADRPFFEVLDQLADFIWGDDPLRRIEVVSLLQQSRKKSPIDSSILRSAREVSFHDLISDGDYYLSAGKGDLIASFYRWYPGGNVLNRGRMTRPLYFSGRIRTETLVPDGFVKLVADVDTPLETKPEAQLCQAPGIRQYRITLVTRSVEEALALSQECLSKEVLEFKGEPPIRLIVSDFGASLERLASGGGERYCWLVNDEILIEFRIHDQQLVEDEQRRFNKELEDRARAVTAPSSSQDSCDLWMPYVRSFAAALFRGEQPELKTNPYLRVVKPNGLRRLLPV